MYNISKNKSGHFPDYVFITATILLTVFGIIFLSSASSDLGKIKFNDTYYYLKHQIYYGLILGIIGFIFASFFHYRHWKRMAVPLLIVGVVSLVLVFTPLGLSHAGANRWISLGFFSFQPTELLKFIFIIYLAAWLSSSRDKNRQMSFFSGYLPFLTICGAIALLIIIQPSTTAVAIIMLSSLIVYFSSGARILYVISTIVLGISALALVIAAAGDYRLERIATFLNPELDTQVTGYQINQSLIAIGSGGLPGVGFGKSTAKFKFLPEPIGDSIFAVIAEELGFIGAGAVMLIFLILVIKGFLIAKNSRDQFAKLTAIGFISIIGIQAFIHIGAISGLIPLTGVPLPFISYGGTSLAIFLTMAGVIVNISKYTS